MKKIFLILIIVGLMLSFSKELYAQPYCCYKARRRYEIKYTKDFNHYLNSKVLKNNIFFIEKDSVGTIFIGINICSYFMNRINNEQCEEKLV